jgi:hypothetical protein
LLTFSLRLSFYQTKESVRQTPLVSCRIVSQSVLFISTDSDYLWTTYDLSPTPAIPCTGLLWNPSSPRWWHGMDGLNSENGSPSVVSVTILR